MIYGEDDLFILMTFIKTKMIESKYRSFLSLYKYRKGNIEDILSNERKLIDDIKGLII